MLGLGARFFLFHREGKGYRYLGLSYIVFLALMMALRAKDYYLAPIYPMLFAAGGVFWEKLAETHTGSRWVRGALPIGVVATGTLKP